MKYSLKIKSNMDTLLNPRNNSSNSSSFINVIPHSSFFHSSYVYIHIVPLSIFLVSYTYATTWDQVKSISNTIQQWLVTDYGIEYAQWGKWSHYTESLFYYFDHISFLHKHLHNTVCVCVWVLCEWLHFPEIYKQQTDKHAESTLLFVVSIHIEIIQRI